MKVMSHFVHMKTSAPIGAWNQQASRPTDQQTNMMGHGKVRLPIN